MFDLIIYSIKFINMIAAIAAQWKGIPDVEKKLYIINIDYFLYFFAWN